LFIYQDEFTGLFQVGYRLWFDNVPAGPLETSSGHLKEHPIELVKNGMGTEGWIYSREI
jgi:hypothetical protein